MDGFQCFIDCIVNAGLVVPLIGLFAAVIICLFLFIVSRRYESLIGAQSFMSVIVSINLLSMNCDMFTWFWIYLGIILIGTIIIVLVKYTINRYIGQNTIGSISSLSDIESEFNVKINVIDSPKIRAFVFMKRIFLSIGLLERLEKDEIRAVVAHELYHLTFSRFSDEYSADYYAASFSGSDNLINALKKLNIKDSKKRIKLLSSY